MTLPRRTDLSAIERQLQEKFIPDEQRGFTSTASDLERSDYVKKLALPMSQRGAIPLTNETYVVNENPIRVEWERHVRVFLLHLNTRTHSHRITAMMIYEWVTGIKITDLQRAAREKYEQEKLINPDAKPPSHNGGGLYGEANMHLRHINSLLKEYFGKSYKTKIAGREVGKAYTVHVGFNLRDTRPKCVGLWPEFHARTLDPAPRSR